MQRRFGKGWTLWIGGLAFAGLLAAPGWTRADETPTVNTGAISLDGGVDFTTAYFFRGIMQRKSGAIGQPYANLTFNIFKKGQGFIKSLDINLGTWNSIHSKNAVGTNGDLYETDYYGGVTLGLGDKWSLSENYYWLTSPNNSYGTVEEIDSSLSYDDSGMYKNLFGGILGDTGLSPHVLFAVETSGAGHSSGGNGYGKYLEAGVSPSFTVLPGKDYPVTLNVPITVGLSVGNYYEGLANSQNETFGFFSVGTDFSVPLTFMPARYGSWSAHVGGTYLWLGNDTARANGNNGFQAIAMAGISFSY